MAQAYLALDLSEIMVPGEEEKVEEGEVAKQEATRVNEAAIKVLELEAIMIGGPKKLPLLPRCRLWIFPPNFCTLLWVLRI